MVDVDALGIFRALTPAEFTAIERRYDAVNAAMTFARQGCIEQAEVIYNQLEASADAIFDRSVRIGAHSHSFGLLIGSTRVSFLVADLPESYRNGWVLPTEALMNLERAERSIRRLPARCVQGRRNWPLIAGVGVGAVILVSILAAVIPAR